MSGDNAGFENLQAQYFEQWAWFRQYNCGDCYTPQDSWSEGLHQEFEERRQAFDELISQMESLPMPYYFCWAEAEFDEHDEMVYRLNSGSLICIRVEALIKERAEVLFDAASYRLRDSWLSYDPDSNSILGNSEGLLISRLDFVFHHKCYGSYPRYLVDLFPAFREFAGIYDPPLVQTWINEAIAALVLSQASPERA